MRANLRYMPYRLPTDIVNMIRSYAGDRVRADVADRFLANRRRNAGSGSYFFQSFS